MRKGHLYGYALGALGCSLAALTTAPLLAEDGSTAVPGELGVEGRQVVQRGIAVPRRPTVVPRGETVTSRPRPELDPLGIRAGSFLVFPRLGLEEDYSDNIFATDDDEESDFITRVQPGLRVESDWNNHALSVFGNADIGRYIDNDGEDYEDLRLGMAGRLDVRRSTNLRARFAYEEGHEERASPDERTGAEPTEFSVLGGGLRGFHNFGRVNLTLDSDLASIDFDDVPTSQGTVIDNDDRDRNEYEVALRAGYEIVPDYEAFLRGSYNIRDYDQASDNNPTLPVDRDSDGYELVAGVAIDFGGITFGDFFLGYRSQDYDDANLDTVEGPVVGADITWNVTRLTTVVGSVSRLVEETIQRDANEIPSSGRFFTTVALSADHELLRNLLLRGELSYSQDDFEGIDRSDDIFRAELGARYMMNRYVYLSGGYNFRLRESDVSAGDFAENAVFLRVQAQY